MPIGLAKDSLADQVVSYLRDYISTNGLKPGDRLPGESELSRALGVSRPIVREASRTLAALGTIATAPGRHSRVSGMGSHVLTQVFEHAIMTGQGDARQVLEVRRGLEIAMAGQAAERRKSAAVERLATLSEQMGEQLGNPEAFVSIDLDFHRALAAATANPFYVVLIEACRAAFAASMDAGLRHRFTHRELQRVQKLHVEIVEGVRQGNVTAATDAMTRHFDDALAALYRPQPPARPARKRGKSD